VTNGARFITPRLVRLSPAQGEGVLVGVGVAVDGGRIGAGVSPGTVPGGIVGSFTITGAGLGDSVAPGLGGTGAGPQAVNRAAVPIMVASIFILPRNRS